MNRNHTAYKIDEAYKDTLYAAIIIKLRCILSKKIKQMSLKIAVCSVAKNSLCKKILEDSGTPHVFRLYAAFLCKHKSRIRRKKASSRLCFLLRDSRIVDT